MHTHQAIAAVTAAAVLAGCAAPATTYRPIVDSKFGDMAAYEQNLGECRSFARQVDQAESAAAGAAVGAILGAGIGLIFGLRGQSLAQVAGAGAAMGGTQSGAYAGMSQVQILRQCMTNRGYAVLQ